MSEGVLGLQLAVLSIPLAWQRRGWSEDIAKVVRGEPGAWPNLVLQILLVGGILFAAHWPKEWWINRS